MERALASWLLNLGRWSRLELYTGFIGTHKILATLLATLLAMSSISLVAFGAQRATSAHRVLITARLLNLTLSFLDQRSNAANACVCKAWSDVALAVLWNDVHDLWRLISLLAPLKKTQDSTYVRRLIWFFSVVY
jgi:hypothetical protein